MTGTGSYGSDAVVDLLAELGIEHIALNPGATFRGLHDSLVNYAAAGPHVIPCLHEEISVALAHGYAKASGRPMAAAVHDVVGLQHASMAVYNAWCDRVPLLLLGATGPVDASKRRPWIDWIHTAQVQATQVRDYTKWDDQPASLATVPESLVRAVQIADTPPRGPVYVCLDAEIQEQLVPAGWSAPDVDGFARPRRPAADPAAVSELAGWLAAAEAPVVVADYVGREQAALDGLVALCELAGVAVVDSERAYNKVSLNFPTHHPLNLSGDAEATLATADLIIGLEARDLFGALNKVTVGDAAPRHPATARVAAVGMAPYVKASWSADYQRLQPADLQVLCEPGPFLAALVPAVQAALADEPGAAQRAARRGQRLAQRSAAMR
ncbi:MAG: thiamine pyrophosphate-binding protein, partial [Egibacteraceae bacterium]